MTIRVYNYGSEITLLTAGKCVKTSGFFAPTDKPTVLQSGWNEITLNITDFNCKEKGELSVLRMTFGLTSGEALNEQIHVAIGEIVLEG
jgi:hypothetical protein